MIFFCQYSYIRFYILCYSGYCFEDWGNYHIGQIHSKLWLRSRPESVISSHARFDHQAKGWHQDHSLIEKINSMNQVKTWIFLHSTNKFIVFVFNLIFMHSIKTLIKFHSERKQAKNKWTRFRFSIFFPFYGLIGTNF